MAVTEKKFFVVAALDIAKHYNIKKVPGTTRMYQKEQPVMVDEIK